MPSKSIEHVIITILKAAEARRAQTTSAEDEISNAIFDLPSTFPSTLEFSFVSD